MSRIGYSRSGFIFHWVAVGVKGCAGANWDMSRFWGVTVEFWWVSSLWFGFLFSALSSLVCVCGIVDWLVDLARREPECLLAARPEGIPDLAAGVRLGEGFCAGGAPEAQLRSGTQSMVTRLVVGEHALPMISGRPFSYARLWGYGVSPFLPRQALFRAKAGAPLTRPRARPPLRGPWRKGAYTTR